jgi:hypothetical protein
VRFSPTLRRKMAIFTDFLQTIGNFHRLSANNCAIFTDFMPENGYFTDFLPENGNFTDFLQEIGNFHRLYAKMFVIC